MLKHKILSVYEKVKILHELKRWLKKFWNLQKIIYFSTLSKNKEKLVAVYNQNKNDCKNLMKCAKKNVDETLLKWMKV